MAWWEHRNSELTETSFQATQAEPFPLDGLCLAPGAELRCGAEPPGCPQLLLKVISCLIDAKASRVSRLPLCQGALMRRVVLGSLLSFAFFACAQQPVGDVYESGGAGAETPAQAVETLYKITATITGDPSSGYDPKTTHWPEADAAQQQWDTSMAANGNTLTQQPRQGLVPCAAHLGTARDSAERGYRIQISQQDNAAAQATVKQLYGTARSEFAQCNLVDALNGSNGNPATGGTGAPIQGGVSTGSNGTPGTTGGGAPGTPQTPGTQSGTPPGPTPQGPPPGSKGVTRTPGIPGVPGTPTPGLPTPKPGTPPPSDTPTLPNIPAFEKAMSDCLNAKVPYAVPPNIDPSYLMKATSLAPDDVRVTPFNKMSAPSQIFLLETAMTLQAQAIRDAKYGANPYDDQDSLNYMVGWLDRCMVNAGQIPTFTTDSPNNPLTLYATYLGVNSDSNQVHYFFEGFTTEYVPPPPLMPPQPPSIVPGLVPLKPNPTSGTKP